MSDDESPYGIAPPGGHRWAWIPSREIPGDRWQVVDPSDARQCRWTDDRVRCEASSVVRLDRRSPSKARAGAGPAWWHYCEQHMYGRRLRNGQVETCIAVPLLPEPGDPR